MCSLSAVRPGDRFRIHIRRFAGTTDTPESRFRVRRYDSISARWAPGSTELVAVVCRP
jgi:hypothetical protein